MDDLRLSHDELMISSRESEKKAKHLEAELMQAQEDLAASERQRRAAEAERDDLQDEISGGLKDRLVVLLVLFMWLFDLLGVVLLHDIALMLMHLHIQQTRNFMLVYLWDFLPTFRVRVLLTSYFMFCGLHSLN